MGNEHTMGIVLERDETEVGAEVDVERIHDTCARGNFNHKALPATWYQMLQ